MKRNLFKEIMEGFDVLAEMRKGENMLEVKVKKMYDDVQLPEYATEGSACFDIKMYGKHGGLPINRELVSSAVLETGLQFEIPEKHVMLVFSRSGQGFKDDVRLANCVGVIDSDYRGELMVKLTNDLLGKNKLVKHGDKIAQGMVIPYEQVKFVVADELSDTVRGEAGFGSTGE
jgi:dUTP pyrophosphatase